MWDQSKLDIRSQKMRDRAKRKLKKLHQWKDDPPAKRREKREWQRVAEHRSIWRGMLRRCYDRTDISYQWYGGRGVAVCTKWANNFWDFYRDMGPRPSDGHSIDRINSDGDYEPDNCRWATAKEQAANRRVRT